MFELKYVEGQPPIHIQRNKIVEDMVEHYRHVKELSWTSFVYSAEDANRDLISEFIAEIFQKFDGTNGKVPGLILEPSELEAFGKAITQRFLQFGAFPSALCLTSLKYHLCKEMDEEGLRSSFLNYLPGISDILSPVTLGWRIFQKILKK